MDRETLQKAILALGGNDELLARFQQSPDVVGAELGLDAEWAAVIANGDRDRLRQAGVPDGITILVSRWFKTDLGDSSSDGRFQSAETTAQEAAVWPQQLVFAGGCSHVPDLLVRPEIDPPEAIERLLGAFAKLDADIGAAKPDVLIVTTDCHFQDFRTAAFAVGTAARHTGSMAFFKRPDLSLDIPGEPTFAGEIVQAIRAQGLEVEDAEQVDLDHGLIVPLRLMPSTADVPIVPIVTQPARSFSPFGARVFGEALREVIESGQRRVAVLATGGLSHWLDPGKFGFVDKEFDNYVLDLLRLGRGLELANLEPLPLLEHGQYEILNWIVMLAIVGPSVQGDVYAYEPLKASGGGWSAVNMQSPTS